MRILRQESVRHNFTIIALMGSFLDKTAVDVAIYLIQLSLLLIDFF